MTCKLDDFGVETTTYTYDAFGNPINQENAEVAAADEPIVLSPPGTCEDEVVFEDHFSYPAEVSYAAPVPAIVDSVSYDGPRFYDPREGRWLDNPMGFGPGDSNLYRYHVPEVEAVVGLQYNEARCYDPNIGRWLSGDPAGFEAGDDNIHKYPQGDK
jgi:RHS repeat-associated protein